MTKLLALALTAAALTACTTSLPSMHTEGPYAGRCITIGFIPILDLGAYTVADIQDGWRCNGLPDGSLPRTGTREEASAALKAELEASLQALKAKKAGAAAPAIVPAVTVEPTWATGE